MLASRNGRLVSLADELRALEHHHLLAATRYGGLTRTEICVDPVSARHLYLPPVSLGELLQNALKHNEVTRTHPLVLQVSLQEDLLIVANVVRPRARPSPSIGMGLTQSRRAGTVVLGADVELGNGGRQIRRAATLGT